MKSKNNNGTNSTIFFILFIIFFWWLFYFCCSYTQVIYTREGYHNKKKHKYLYKVKYECDGSNQVKANSPQVCCTMNNKIFSCDYMKNCKCKNKHTGYCETCYPKIKKKNSY
jgi:hypothetical protein